MKSILGQGQVQASNNLGANGGVLGAMVGIYAKKKDYEVRHAYQTSLMEFDNQLKERRQLTGTVHGIVADLASQSTKHNYSMVEEAAKAKNKITQTREEGRQERLTTGHGLRTGLEVTKKMTAGLETSAGLPLSGGISPLVAGPNQYQGQLQAFKGPDGAYHPHMGMPVKDAGQAPAVVTPDTSNPEMPAAAKGGKGKKVKPFADPSVEKNVKPVPSEVASPFGATSMGGRNPLSESDAADTNTRASIFADASYTPSKNAPAVAAETPNVATPKARIKKA